MSKTIFRAHFEQIWNNKDARGSERFIATNYRGFDAAELISGIEGYKQHFVTITTGFPDLRITIEVILEEPNRVEEENRVAARQRSAFAAGLRAKTGLLVNDRPHIVPDGFALMGMGPGQHLHDGSGGSPTAITSRSAKPTCHTSAARTRRPSLGCTCGRPLEATGSRVR